MNKKIIILFLFCIIFNSSAVYAAKCIKNFKLVNCPTVFGDDIPKKAAEELWGDMGKLAYPAAAAIMKARSSTGQSLPASVSNELQPYVGNTGKKVSIHWNVKLLDEWAHDTFKISLTGTESEAQTYGYDIYIRKKKPAIFDDDTLALLVHEITHTMQFEQNSKSLDNFGYEYFKEYKKANQTYENNKLEKEAAKNQEKFLYDRQPITHIDVTAGKNNVKCLASNLNKIPMDLNKGAGGDYIYLCEAREDKSTYLVDIKVTISSDNKDHCPVGYKRDSVNLNQGTSGKYIYFCRKYSSSSPIMKIKFVSDPSDENKAKVQCNSGWTLRGEDLNSGAGGDFIYLCFKK